VTVEHGSYDLIALGETMVALAAPAGESIRQAAVWGVDHAGAESNTCVGLARLGFRVAWVSRVGTDAMGDRILDALAAERVDIRWVRRDPERVTGMMVKDPDAGVRYYRTGSAASALSPGDLDGVPVADARAVLVTGVTALIGTGPRAAGLALLDSARGLRIVDPNLRTGLWGSHRRAELVRPFVARCNLLLAGSQELAELVGGDPHDLNALAQRAAALRSRGRADPRPERIGSSGPSLEHRQRAPAGFEADARSDEPRPDPRQKREAVRHAGTDRREVVVRGASAIGSRAADGTWREFDIQRGDAIDPIGAGDAFNAGYLAVRLRNGTVEDAVGAGIRCGAAVVSAVSDTSAFPRTLC
jgi:sugar/nucleoside kinase (ribokinase family)